MRGFGAAAVCASAVAAGTMASRKGSATLAPRLRSTWRRERCFLVMNMAVPPGSSSVVERQAVAALRGQGLHLESGALHDALHDAVEAVVIRRRLLHDAAYR